MILKLSWRNLWRNKRRTFITMASIFFAVILAIMMKSMKEGVYSKMLENTAGTITGYIQVHKAGFWEEQSLDNSFKNDNSIKNIIFSKEIKYAIPHIESFLLASNKDKIRGSMLIGIDPTLENETFKLKSKLVQGSYLKVKNDVLIGRALAEYLELSIGDTLVTLGQGYHGANAAGKFHVSGILRMGNPELDKSILYMNLKDAQYLFDMNNLITSIIIIPNNINKSELIANEMESSLGDNFEVMSWQELIPEIDSMIKGDRAEGTILMGILYMIIAFGIFGTILMMLSERNREFGILISIGMKKSKLALTVFLETVIISILACLIGMISAFPFVYYFYLNPINFGSDEEFAKMYEEYGLEPVLQTSIDIEIFFEQTMVVALFAGLISLYPYYKITKLNVLNSLRK